MCDVLHERNITGADRPQFVYKVVQKIGPGRCVTPIMGQLIVKDKWNKAKDLRSSITNNNKRDSLINRLRIRFKNVFKSCDLNSSEFSEHHRGKFGTFKTFCGANGSNIRENFVDEGGNTYRRVIIKCEVKGKIHRTSYMYHPTYLCQYLKPVEEYV